MIISNEKIYAESLLNQDMITESPYFAISILAKYYYHHLGYRKTRIIKQLTNFLEKKYPKYRIQKQSWTATIEKVASKAGKYPLYEVDEILITKDELNTIDCLCNNDTISRLDNSDIKNIKRLAFTMLCLAKLGNAKSEKYNGWVNTRTADLIKFAKINCSQKHGQRLISYLNAAGLVDLPKKNTNLSNRVTFINDCSEPALYINDFRELGYAYLKYCGENIVECNHCGILIRGNASGTKRYCNECNGSNVSSRKRITCVDCGFIFTVPSKNNRTCRCVECQEIKNREDIRKRVERYRNNIDNFVTITNEDE